jgi:hypothetical protein
MSQLNRPQPLSIENFTSGRRHEFVIDALLVCLRYCLRAFLFELLELIIVVLRADVETVADVRIGEPVRPLTVARHVFQFEWLFDMTIIIL